MVESNKFLLVILVLVFVLGVVFAASNFTPPAVPSFGGTTTTITTVAVSSDQSVAYYFRVLNIKLLGLGIAVVASSGPELLIEAQVDAVSKKVTITVKDKSSNAVLDGVNLAVVKKCSSTGVPLIGKTGSDGKFITPSALSDGMYDIYANKLGYSDGWIYMTVGASSTAIVSAVTCPGPIQTTPGVVDHSTDFVVNGLKNVLIESVNGISVNDNQTMCIYFVDDIKQLVAETTRTGGGYMSAGSTSINYYFLPYNGGKQLLKGVAGSENTFFYISKGQSCLSGLSNIDGKTPIEAYCKVYASNTLWNKDSFFSIECPGAGLGKKTLKSYYTYLDGTEVGKLPSRISIDAKTDICYPSVSDCKFAVNFMADDYMDNELYIYGFKLNK
ncbi:MAG: hypothetical protein NTY48_03170 [Candidatus Diapherotrites archaeon]|nr:hypothetical protein [Candidatus Diapherotrites archaeon]